MDIHKPKPIHGWRDLFKEIGIIVIGVLIALAAEQIVDWWHWQHELRETRQALQTELARAVGSFEYDVAAQACSDRRLDELGHWLDRSQPGERLPAVRPIGMPLGYTLLFSTWDVAKGGQAAWRMPLEERLQFAHLYGSLARFREISQENQGIWHQMAQFTGAEPLDHADRMRLRGLVAQGQVVGLTIRNFSRFITPDVTALGIVPEKRPAINLEGRTQSFCMPLFAR